MVKSKTRKQQEQLHGKKNSRTDETSSANTSDGEAQTTAKTVPPNSQVGKRGPPTKKPRTENENDMDTEPVPSASSSDSVYSTPNNSPNSSPDRPQLQQADR